MVQRMFDAAFTVTSELSTLSNRNLTLLILTDNKSLIDSIYKGCRTSEKRMILDISAAGEGYGSGALSDIGLLRSELNFTDALTKPMSQKEVSTVMVTGQHSPSQ